MYPAWDQGNADETPKASRAKATQAVQVALDRRDNGGEATGTPGRSRQ
jgi:hypothetical protein